MANRGDDSRDNRGDDSRDGEEHRWVKIPEGATHIITKTGFHNVYFHDRSTDTEDLMKVAEAATTTEDLMTEDLMKVAEDLMQITDASTQTDEISATKTEAAKFDVSTQEKATICYSIHSADSSIDSASSSASEVLCLSQPPGDKQLPGTQHEPTPKISVRVSVNVNANPASST